MDPVGFQAALGGIESLPSDSVEALVASWNYGLTGAMDRVGP